VRATTSRVRTRGPSLRACLATDHRYITLTSGRGMTGENALEHRYLFAWSPAGHRRTYAEEMIGVLLAAAPKAAAARAWPEPST
jgi:hypothetical protein